jgi:hypothetical protein
VSPCSLEDPLEESLLIILIGVERRRPNSEWPIDLGDPPVCSPPQPYRYNRLDPGDSLSCTEEVTRTNPQYATQVEKETPDVVRRRRDLCHKRAVALRLDQLKTSSARFFQSLHHKVRLLFAIGVCGWLPINSEAPHELGLARLIV